MLKTLISWISAGALVGLFLASLVGPKYLGWYNSVGTTSGAQAICDMPKLTNEITSRLLQLQVEGAAVGAVVFLIIGIVLLVRRRKAPPAAATA